MSIVNGIFKGVWDGFSTLNDSMDKQKEAT